MHSEGIKRFHIDENQNRSVNGTTAAAIFALLIYANNFELAAF